LQRYKDVSNLDLLSTTLTDEDEEYTYFSSISPSLSYFVVAGDKKKTIIEKIFGEKEEEKLENIEEETESITKPTEDKPEKEDTKNNYSTWLMIISVFIVFIVVYFFIQSKIKKQKKKEKG